MKKAKHILLLFLIICMSVFILSSCDGLDMEKVNEILAGLKGGAGNPDCIHTGAEWVVKNEASCTADGEKILVCPDCSAIVSTESIPALGHDEASHEAKPACTGTGWDAYVTCSRCDYTTYVEKAATGHNFENKVCIWCGDEKASEGLNFTSNGDGTCSVSGIGTCTDTDIIIPEVSPDGDRVTSIGDHAFPDCSSITSVTIGNSVTYIGIHTFSGCKSLTSVTIGNSVTYISDSAFDDCTSLTSITLGNSVTNIGDWAFSGCDSLTTVYYGGSEEDWSDISIGFSGDTWLTNATRYYYSESEPTEAGNFWHYDENGNIEIW